MGQRLVCQLPDSNFLVTGHKSRTERNVYPAWMNMAHCHNPWLRNTETIFCSNQGPHQEIKECHTACTSPEMSLSTVCQTAFTYAMLQACSWPQRALRYLIQQMSKSLTVIQTGSCHKYNTAQVSNNCLSKDY